MLKNSLTAGVARIDITPPLGFRMAGAMRRTEGATGIESPLLATALVLADDLLKIVIISCDLIGLDPPLANEIRDQIGKRLSISSSNVVLGCTHTHNGPCTSRGNIGGVHDIGGEAWEIEALDDFNPHQINWDKVLDMQDNESVESVIEDLSIPVSW